MYVGYIYVEYQIDVCRIHLCRISNAADLKAALKSPEAMYDIAYI